MINTIINISSFKRTYNDKFNNKTSDSKIEQIAKSNKTSDSKIKQIVEVNKTSDSKIEKISKVSPESKRDKGAHEIPNTIKYSISGHIVCSRDGDARKGIMQ